jgi:hypothetical protein
MSGFWNWVVDILIAAALLIFFACMFFAPLLFERFALQRYPQFENNSFAAGITFIVYMVVAFLVRQYRRVAYGLAECGFCLIGYVYLQSQRKFETIVPTVFAAAGLIYVGVRGLDNIMVGVRARRAKASAASQP